MQLPPNVSLSEAHATVARTSRSPTVTSQRTGSVGLMSIRSLIKQEAITVRTPFGRYTVQNPGSPALASDQGPSIRAAWVILSARERGQCVGETDETCQAGSPADLPTIAVRSVTVSFRAFAPARRRRSASSDASGVPSSEKGTSGSLVPFSPCSVVVRSTERYRIRLPAR